MWNFLKYFCPKICVQKCKIGNQKLQFGKFRGKIEIVGTHNLLCWKQVGLLPFSQTLHGQQMSKKFSYRKISFLENFH